MKPKYKQIVIEKAAEEQREYEVNGVQECVEEKIKVYLQNKFEETFSSYAENICDNIKTYSDIKLLPIWEFTKIIGEDDISRIYRDNPTSAICKWLVNVLENDFGVRRFNRDNSLSDHAFEKMLDAWLYIFVWCRRL